MDEPISLGEAWAIMFAKGKVPRRVVELGFDPASYPLEAYDAVPGYLAPYQAAAAEAPATRSGLRWRYEGEAVLFTHHRDLAAPYEDLVERVDISGGIRLMNDYIGGCTEVVSRDEQGRVVRQAERNCYLPQPNWMAFSGGCYIDVCKLERIDRDEDSCRISWRTVSSPNESAVHDDGSMTFARIDGQRTRVTVSGLQLFTLPPAWALAEPWIEPALKDSLVEDSYRRFFTATLDNVEAAYEGRDYAIGCEPGATEPWDVRLDEMLQVLRAVLPDDPVALLAEKVREGRTQRPDLVDENGFRHFSAGQSATRREPDWVKSLRGWQEELAEVIRSDTKVGLGR